MNDDNLDDTQKINKYCHVCDSDPCQCNKPESVGIVNSKFNIYQREIWNAAIEAAARKVDGGWNAEAIRELKI